MAQAQQVQDLPGFHRRQLTTYPADMKMLGGVVLGTKKDIKFNRNASHSAGAERLARRKGWQCQVADINNDDIDDIVLFDKRGHPVIINGYSLKKSEHKIREKYFDEPINTRVSNGGYKAFKNAMRDNAQFRLEMQGWPDAYAKIAPTPRRRPNANPAGTVYKRFCDRMKPRIEQYIRDKYSSNGQHHPSLVNAMMKIIPMSSILAYFYYHSVIDSFWNYERCAAWRQSICEKTDNEHRRCDLFKKALSKNAGIVERIATDDRLDTIVANYDDEQMDRCFEAIGINHDDIYQEAVIPVDGNDLTSPQNRGIIAFEKERISDAVLTAKDDLITNMFSPAREQEQFAPEDDEA